MLFGYLEGHSCCPAAAIAVEAAAAAVGAAALAVAAAAGGTPG